jgi:hypothetical protein
MKQDHRTFDFVSLSNFLMCKTILAATGVIMSWQQAQISVSKDLFHTQ